MNQVNQGYNPLAPEIGPTADQMLQAYRDRAAALRGEQAQETPQSFNPYQPEESKEDTQGQHVANMQQWLSPVKMDAFDAQSHYTEEKHDNFLSNLESDPAVKEYGEGFHAYLEYLQNSNLSDEEKDAMGRNYIENVVKPIISKHHKKGEQGESFHKKREPEIPDIVKRVRGIK
ncbi:hypothetical protein R0R95_004640 [Salmonella enterica]|nr:hypothetical protein [Salmonella enterica]